MPEPGFKPKQPGLQPEQQERKEWGRNVALTLKIMRHGDRDKQKNLSEYGRKETRQRAKDLGIKPDDFDAIKAIGSSAGPEREIEVNGKKVSMGRALETAHIYADELDSENEFVTRVNDLLNFETIKTPAPHDRRRRRRKMRRSLQLITYSACIIRKRKHGKGNRQVLLLIWWSIIKN
jgi:hypothetical protein